eukprot:14028929-Alexandrium_andersonii.AAC.1
MASFALACQQPQSSSRQRGEEDLYTVGVEINPNRCGPRLQQALHRPVVGLLQHAGARGQGRFVRQGADSACHECLQQPAP